MLSKMLKFKFYGFNMNYFREKIVLLKNCMTKEVI